MQNKGDGSTPSIAEVRNVQNFYLHCLHRVVFRHSDSITQPVDEEWEIAE
jgi:hypothetical protein